MQTSGEEDLVAHSPENMNHLLEAFDHLSQALAMTESDTEKDSILQVMSLVKALAQIEGKDAALPTKTAFAAADMYCKACKRNFVSQASMDKHNKTVHSEAKD